MTKTEQNRVLARRLKVLREASARPGTWPRPAVISAYRAKRSISGRLDTKLRARQVCVTEGYGPDAVVMCALAP